MKEGTRIKLKQWRIIIIAWMIMGFFITIYDYLVIQTSYSAGLATDYLFLIAMARNVGAGLVGALLGGYLLVFYINEKLQDRSYGYTIIIVGISFLLIVALITLLMGIILVPFKTGLSLS